MFYSFLLKSLCHFPWGIAHCLFWFQPTSCDLLEGEIMASHFEEEMDATFQISVVSVFLVQESGPVGIFKDFKIQFPIRLVAEIIFSSFEKKTETKTLAGRSREIFCVLSSKQRFAMRTKIKPLDPGYPKEFSVGWRQKFFCTEHNFECASLAREVAVNFCATTTTKKWTLENVLLF